MEIYAGLWILQEEYDKIMQYNIEGESIVQYCHR